nr:serine/threonine-protein kinase [Paludisphaera mucosa]
MGRGGSGVVYEAVQPRLGRRVAVKILAGGPALDARARERWLREARAVARVRHPNVVRLHEAGEHDGRLYLVLDLIPGGSLRDLAPGPIPPRDAARLVEAVARAVEEIHRVGLLHLDVKPSNILMDGPADAGWEGRTPMLSDFGIARDEAEAFEASVSGTLGARGTPAFMAPEQVDGRPGAIGPAADVFALGATLYALLTGRPPFQGASAIETLDLLRATEPPPPRSLAPGVPRDLETACLKALQKAPSRRYASAAALADDLRRWLDGRPIEARPVSAAGRLARWCRRRPAPAALAAALAVTILVALAGLAALWRRSEHQRGLAEAARVRALRGEATADDAVADLVALLRRSVEVPGQFSSERTDDATAAVLDLTAKLRRTPALVARHATAIAAMEMGLANIRDRNGARDDALRLMDDAADLVAATLARAGAGDDRVQAAVRLADIVMRRGGSQQDRARFAAAAEDLRLAERTLAPHVDDPRAYDALAALRHLRIYLARAAPAAAGPEPGRAPRTTADPILNLVDALAECEARGPGSPTAAAWEALDRVPAATRLPRTVELLLADLAAREICESTDADVRDGDRFDPEATARRILDGFDAGLARLRPSPTRTEDVLERLSQYATLQAIAARRAGRLDEARRSARWTVALGRAIGRRDPRSAGPHLLLGRAFEQESKIAWRVPDEAAVERSLRVALAEMTLALALAPDREDTRRSLAGLREKYLRLAAAEPES